MRSSSRDEIQADLNSLRAAVSRVVGHSYDALTTPERLALLEGLERETRRLRAPGHELINQIAERAGPQELGGPLPHALADRLRITRGEARRRVAEAADLGPRRALTGEPLPPVLTGTAAAQRAGTIGAGHVRVIRRFLHQLPNSPTSGPARKPKRIWPSWPPSIAPTIWRSSPSSCPRTSTPTAPTPTRTAPVAAA